MDDENDPPATSREPEPSQRPASPGPPGQHGRGASRRPGTQADRPAGPSERDARDDRKRRREGGERRSFAGFGDETDRAYCLAYRHRIPETFPVVHRQGAATLRVSPVARRPGAVLFCDGGHPGPHAWPDGEPVEDVSRES